MGCRAFFAIPAAGAGFFFSSWLLMIFVGILADDLGIRSLSYVDSMVATIALWLVMAPLIGTIAGRSRRRAMFWRRWRQGNDD